MSSRIRAVLVALAVTLVGAGLVACGGGDDSNNNNDGGGDEVNANELLEETFSGDKQVDSGNLTVAANIEAEGSEQVSGPIVLEVTGPFQTGDEGQLPSFDLTLDVSAQGQSFNAGAISTGDAGFLEFQDQAYEVPTNLFEQFQQGFEQAQQEGQGEGQSLASLGINPLDWVEDPQVDGDEEVGGADTTKISAGINVPNLVNDLNDALRAVNEQGLDTGQQVPEGITDEQRQQIEEALQDPRFTVWTGTEDRILRKLELSFNVQVPEERRSEAGGVESAQVRFSIEIANLNEPQTIEAPANPRPLSELLAAFGLGGDLGGSLGGDSGAESGGSTGPSPPDDSGSAPGTEEFDQYSQCIQDAGEDVQALQECADLLTTP